MSEKNSRCSRTLQPQSFDHGSEFLAGTQAGFARGTDRIRGTGRLYRSWLGFGRGDENACEKSGFSGRKVSQ
jgi:hypothetical protein